VDVIVCTAGMDNVFADQCVYESDHVGAGSAMVWAVLKFVMMVALTSKLINGH